MTGNTSWQTRLRPVFNEECRRFAAKHPTVSTADMTPVYWLVCEVAAEVAGDADAMHHLHPLVRRRVLDRIFVGETGDTVMDPHYQLPIDVEVDLVVSVVGRVIDMTLQNAEPAAY